MQSNRAMANPLGVDKSFVAAKICCSAGSPNRTQRYREYRNRSLCGRLVATWFVRARFVCNFNGAAAIPPGTFAATRFRQLSKITGIDCKIAIVISKKYFSAIHDILKHYRTVSSPWNCLAAHPYRRYHWYLSDEYTTKRTDKSSNDPGRKKIYLET